MNALPPNDETAAGNAWERWWEGLKPGDAVSYAGDAGRLVEWGDEGTAAVVRLDGDDEPIVVPAIDVEPPVGWDDVKARVGARRPPLGTPFPPEDPGGAELDAPAPEAVDWRGFLREPLVLLGLGVLLGTLATWWELKPPPCADWAGLVEAAACPSGGYLARSEVVRINGPAAVEKPALLHVDCRCRPVPRTETPESRP